MRECVFIHYVYPLHYNTRIGKCRAYRCFLQCGWIVAILVYYNEVINAHQGNVRVFVVKPESERGIYI